MILHIVCTHFTLYWNSEFAIWTSSWHLLGICSIWLLLVFGSGEIKWSWTERMTSTLKAYICLPYWLLHLTYTVTCLVNSTYTCSVWTVHVCANSTASSRTCACSVIWKPMEICTCSFTRDKNTTFTVTLTVSETLQTAAGWPRNKVPNESSMSSETPGLKVTNRQGKSLTCGHVGQQKTCYQEVCGCMLSYDITCTYTYYVYILRYTVTVDECIYYMISLSGTL